MAFDQTKTQDFWEDGRETINRGHETLAMFGKLLVNFPERPEMVDYYIFSTIYIQHKLSKHVVNTLVRQ